jgi:sugar O-acyltransferase (sialic acid O-acetyltransferase NeuD family)
LKSKLIIIGASGHGKVVADIAKLNGYENIAFLDDDEAIKNCSGYPVIGKVNDAEKFSTSTFFVAIGNNRIRQKIMNKISDLQIVTLIHPKSVIANSVILGSGTVVMAGTVINPETTVGKGCIINTCSSVDHDCFIKDFAHISVGAHLCGTVSVGNNCWIGAGATVCNNTDICDDVILGAGSVVIKNVIKPGTYVGVPAHIV